MSGENGVGPYGAPIGRHELDEGFWDRARTWLEEIHPDSCLDAFEAMFELHPYKCDGTFCLLLGHLVDVHSAGLLEIARVCGHLHYLSDEISGPVLDAMGRNRERLREEMLERWDELEEISGGSEAAFMFFRSLPPDELAALVEELWETDHPIRSPTVYERGLGAFFFLEEQSERASSFFERNFEDIASMYPDRVISFLLRANGLAGIRDGCLDRMLEMGGVDAARLILEKFRYEEPHPIILRSLDILMDEVPDDPMTNVGLVLSLDLDAERVLPILAGRVNAVGSLSRFNGYLAWKMREWDVPRLVEALAEDALKKDKITHPSGAA